VAGAGVEPPGGVSGGNAAAELQAAGPGGEGFAGGGFVARTQLDDVAAGEAVIAESRGAIRRGFLADEIFDQAFAVVPETPADDLFDLAPVEVDTRAEAAHGRGSGGGGSAHIPSNRRVGFSIHSLTRMRKVTASLPSTRRWS